MTNRAGVGRIAATVLVGLGLSFFLLRAPLAEAKTYVVDACSESEEWTLDERLPKAWMERFLKSIVAPGKKGIKAEQIFDSIYVAQRLKSGANGPELRALADYWVARSLYQSGFIHLANLDFGAMVDHLPAGLTGIQIGAVECLNRVHDRYPSLRYPETIVSKLVEMQQRKLSLRQKRIVWNAALSVLLGHLNFDEENKVGPALAVLKGAGAYESIARAWISIKTTDFNAAVTHFEAFVHTEKIPPSLMRYREVAYLSLGRLYSQEKKFPESVKNFQLVSKASNYFSQAIADLAWTHLIAHNLGAAVGAASDIRRSGLKRSFSPAADMAFAVSLFELCRYPEALRAHAEFKHRYQKSYDWLTKWEQTDVVSMDTPANYKLVVGFLKGDSPVPEAVGSEWLRSPVFQSLQDEINLLMDEHAAADYFYQRSGKIKVAGYQKGLQSVLVAWRQQLKTFINDSNKIELELVKKIGEDLAETNRSLLSRLQSVDDEMEFLKTEIYDAAGEDIVWQNVNKGFDKFAKVEGITSKGQEDGSDKLRWEVRRNPTSESTDEIWEDELGALETEQLDLCRTKNKFLKKKKSQIKEKTVSDPN